MLRRRLPLRPVGGSLLPLAARGGVKRGVPMRFLAMAAVAGVLTVSTTASAQNYAYSSVSASARNIYAACARMTQTQGAADVRASCACITGYMGGAMNDRDFEVAAILLRVGEMTESGVPEATIQAEIMAFFERGFTEADVQRVAAMVDQMSTRGDAVCSQFEQQGSV